MAGNRNPVARYAHRANRAAAFADRRGRVAQDLADREALDHGCVGCGALVLASGFRCNECWEDQLRHDDFLEETA